MKQHLIYLFFLNFRITNEYMLHGAGSRERGAPIIGISSAMTFHFAYTREMPASLNREQGA
jgi:hypothetical protein